MKLCASIYNLKNLNKLINVIDCAILNSKEYSLIYDDLDLQVAYNLCLNNNIMPIIAVNKMLYEDDLDKIDDLFNKYKNAYFLATDLAVYKIALKYNMVNKVIYDPETMITNYLDLNEYYSFGFNACSMSLEIPINDVIDSIKKTNAKVFMQIFGHRRMFYSKRHLLSLYEKKANIKIKTNNLYIKEINRNEFFPIIENNNGTTIYRDYLISYIDNINDLNLEYGYLESLYLDDNKFVNVCKIYKDYLENVISLENAKNKINELFFNIKDGFKYQDSIYQKELF